jgi:hypothetical protein
MLAQKCKNCNYQNKMDAMFCNQCGKALTINTSLRRPGSQSQLPEEGTFHIASVSSDPNIPSSGWQLTPNSKESFERDQSEMISKKKSITGKMPEGNIRGEVRGFNTRVERKIPNLSTAYDEIVWTFRLECYQNGQRLSPIPVELRGQTFTGFINEGDTVEIIDYQRVEGLLRTKQVFNVTNQTLVKVKKTGDSKFLKFWNLGIVLIGLLFICGLVYLIAKTWNF